ncbi:uncharacterized protein PAC_15859 [Phialocephala subalpina]|uniref:NmrA-like domain-containing protein n=1 Tax=Phialocephala subalpina TaxID=576137 RepID=A0A1L7XLP4_9HELO|nr:uncharacterized protein PAC_15859 [Phialocephala subalpina]
MSEIRKLVVVATPASPLLPSLLHELSHKPDLSATVLTRETSISLPRHSSHSHSHDHDPAHPHTGSEIQHIKIDFSFTELTKHFKSQDAVVCLFSGSDLHLSAMVIDAATAANIKLLIPSEFGLDTSNSKIRELLPPYKTRFEVQEKLQKSGVKWKAIYSGTMLEEAMKTDGVFGIDVMWGSAVVFPGADKLKVAVSTYDDVAKEIISVLEGKDGTEPNEIHTSTFTANLDELVKVVEKELDKTFDRYEGDFNSARKEAKERMQRGYFDGGVALMGRVAVWDSEVGGWEKWSKNENALGWEEKVAKVTQQVRKGEIGGDGCGC